MQIKPKRNSFTWGKTAGMLFATGIPALLVGIANHKVFPDSSWLATGMVIITFGIAVIFAVASEFATPKVKRYVLIASVVLSVELAANLACHWVLAREVSGARQATTARHEDEDRAEARKEAEAKRQRELMAEQRALTAETARQLRYEAIRNDSARRLGMRVARGATVTTQPPPVTLTTPEPAASVTPATKPAEASLTVEQVMASWLAWLVGFAIADLLTSVVAFGICGLCWEWDLNHDGIPDHLQKGNEVEQDNPFPHQVGK